jgi:hypothetical protein
LEDGTANVDGKLNATDRDYCKFLKLDCTLSDASNDSVILMILTDITYNPTSKLIA